MYIRNTLPTTQAKKYLWCFLWRNFTIIMEELEELNNIRLYDDATAANEPALPIDEAFKQIEAKRNEVLKQGTS